MRYEEEEFKGLYDRRLGQPSPRRATTNKVKKDIFKSKEIRIKYHSQVSCIRS
jgi:hypothetical protein